ncbi:MAG: nucleotidyltransferase family protein [Thermodesulfobacteriota bacterium]|nr:nucleotidyltransferase family protein [Thermodesulfobacteriota bacterium]
MGYRTVILAGDGNKSRAVYGKNKALLEMNNRPIVSYVVSALLGSSFVGDIKIVGPQSELRKALSPHIKGFEDKIDLCEQKGSLFENAWHGVLTHLSISNEEIKASEVIYSEEPFFFISGDLPLITTYEIDQFLKNCNVAEYDYMLGLTREEFLIPYYPKDHNPGIKMAYFHLKNKLARINNLHLIKPFQVESRHYIQEVYDYRYQLSFKNVLALGVHFLQTKAKFMGTLCFMALQLSSIFSRIGLTSFTRIPRRFCCEERLHRTISRILGTRFTTIETTYGGAALDIDNEKDYEIMRAMFQRWRDYQDESALTLSAGLH